MNSCNPHYHFIDEETSTEAGKFAQEYKADHVQSPNSMFLWYAFLLLDPNEVSNGYLLLLSQWDGQNSQL